MREKPPVQFDHTPLIDEQAQRIAFLEEWKRLMESQRFGSRSEKASDAQGLLFNEAELDPSVRIFGPDASVAQDLEPEYIAVAPDSSTAYVTLQEELAGWKQKQSEAEERELEILEAIETAEATLAQHAEDTLERIGQARTPMVREVFRNLVTAQGTRVARERGELLSVFEEKDRAAADGVLATLVDARLLTSFERAGDESDERRQEIEDLERMVVTDPLTGLLNRRAIDDYLGAELRYDPAASRWSGSAALNYTESDNQNFYDGEWNSSTAAEVLDARLRGSALFGGTHDDVQHRVTAGLDYIQTDFSQRGIATPWGDPNQDQDYDQSSLAAEYVGQLFEDFTWTANARYNDFSDFDSITTWQVAFSHQVSVDMGQSA